MPDPNKMSRLWDQRYGEKEYAYGKEANAYFSAQLGTITPGHMLLPGEGEGRNAVYAAKQGWSVDAFDLSHEGQSKALALASESGVEVNYRVCPINEFTFIPNHYDAIGLLFLHTDPLTREYLHGKAGESLKPGGILILEGFHKDQLTRNSGGPKSLEMLFDEKSLAGDFVQLEKQLLEKQEIFLDEGPFHQGEASVIRYRGVKIK